MAIDALEFPELHDESIPAMAFVKALTQLMAVTGVKDFTHKVAVRGTVTFSAL